jgi:hypothetical protein
VLILLILIFLLTFLVLGGLLWGGTRFVQGAVYSEPAGDLHWRAPAAGAALTLFLVLWTVADCAAGGHCRALHEMSTAQVHRFDELIIEPKAGKEEPYQLTKQPTGGAEYHRGDRKLPSRPEKIIVVEDGRRTTFEPDRDEKGRFKATETPGFLALPLPGAPKETRLHYRDDRGRVMVEGGLGEVSVFHGEWLALTLLFNFGFLAAWFTVLWLLLRYQWGHALLGAVILWAATTFIAVPMLLSYAEQVFNVGAAK